MSDQLHFDNFTFDFKKGLLYRDGELLEVELRIIKFLQLLIARFPETIPRNELIETLWPNQQISDWALAQLISRSRKVLNDDSRSPRYIKTIHGVGVRWLKAPQPVEDPVQPSVGQNNNLQWRKGFRAALFAGVVIVLLVLAGYFWWSREAPAPSSVALLPIDNATGNVVNDWVRLGLMDMINHNLSRHNDLGLIGTDKLLAYLDEEQSAHQSDAQHLQADFKRICSAVGCDVLVYAKLVQASPVARIEYHVIDSQGVRPKRQVQSNTIVDAGAVLANAMAKILLPASPWAIDNQDTYSSDSGANRAYALGTHELLNGDPKAAVQYLNIALLKVPDFLWAKAKLADAYYRTNEIEQAQKLIDELIKLPKLSNDIRYAALHVQSNLQYATGKLLESRRTSESLLVLARALNDPLAEAAESMNIGTSYQASGKISEAKTYLDQGLLLYKKAAYKPGIGMAFFNIGNLYMSVNNEEKAALYYARAETIFDKLGNLQFAAITRYQQANLLVRAGELEKAREVYLALLPVYERLGDTEGYALTTIDLASISMSLDGDEQGLKLLLDYLPKLQQEGLQYARLQAHKRLAAAYLNLHQPDMARKYMPEESEFVTADPSETLLPAHLAYEENRFEDAVSLAQEAKKRAGIAWKPWHQKILQAYQHARETGVRTDIRI